MRRKRIDEPAAPEVAIVEQQLNELIPVEATREEKEAEVERAAAEKLKEVEPELRPLDKKERSIKTQLVDLVKANKDKKGFFQRGRRSISTRAGVVGIKKGPAHIRLGKGVVEKDIIEKIKSKYPEIAPLVIETKERLHRTWFRQQVRNGNIPKPILREFKITLVQKEHVYARTKRAKRGPVKASAKGTMRKQKNIR
jgi:hypothetical protein